MSLFQMILLFLKIGLTSFGGYMALVAHVQDNIVEKKKWLSREEFLDGLALAQMLPGPTGPNVVTYVGQKLRGTLGAVASLIAVIAPSFILMVMLSELYLRYRYLPQLEVFLAGVNPAVIALLLVVAIRLGRQSIRSPLDMAVAAAGLALAVFFKGNFALVILIIGLLGVLVYRNNEGVQPPPEKNSSGSPDKAVERGKGDRTGGLMAIMPLTAILTISPDVLAQLFLLFFKIGAVIFGGGYVMIPFIQKEVVDIHHLVSRREFVDGLAMGQATPGPIVITAVFIGYKVAGLAGAVASVSGIFMPSTILVILLARYMPWVKQFSAARSFLKGIQAAIAGILLFVAFSLGQTVITDISGLILLAVGFLLMLWNKVDNVFIILGSGLAGLFLHFLTV